MDEIYYNWLLIKVNDSTDQDTIDEIAQQLQIATGLTVGLTYKDEEET